MVTSAAAYHADDVGCPAPSLSKSIAHILCTSSPAHAYAAHPKLGAPPEQDHETRWDIGTACHSLLLEGIDKAHVVYANDWKTVAAREARDEARAHGLVPLLPHQHDAVVAMVEAVHAQLDQHHADPPLFKDGQAEQTLMWEDGGVWCRSRLDWLRDDLRAIDDLKTTSASAHPLAWGARTLFSVGGELQAAMYIRAVERTRGYRPEFRFCVVETSPPYALSVVGVPPSVLALGEAKLNYAIERWRVCLETGVWPAYSQEVCYPELPAWEEARWLEREVLETAA